MHQTTGRQAAAFRVRRQLSRHDLGRRRNSSVEIRMLRVRNLHVRRLREPCRKNRRVLKVGRNPLRLTTGLRHKTIVLLLRRAGETQRLRRRAGETQRLRTISGNLRRRRIAT